MMILRFVHQFDVTATETVGELGEVPVVGKSKVVTRGWFQCSECGLVAAFDGMKSPMYTPECPTCCADPAKVS